MDPKIEKDAFEYHKKPPAGKIAVKPTKPLQTQKDLSLAYTPGVAAPCLEIAKDVGMVWEYTSRGNTVVILSDGTAVLGLGNIGPRASLPVMEGKAVLFKRFADVDGVPIVVDYVKDENGQPDVEKIVSIVKHIEHSFGGINLEDIKAPQCFEIERRLKEETHIPVFHDDQHGTAIITLAALWNSLEMAKKDISDVKVVFNGAGAAAIASARYYVSAGVKKVNITMCDSRGVIHSGRDNLNKYKQEFAKESDCRTLADAMEGADIFVGLSIGNVVSKEMVQSMKKDPIVIAMANPEPEIRAEDAHDAGAFIVATGRSDYPNQVNNVLGFPGIFRGAIDVRATDVNEAMKLGASKAIADIAKEKVPDKIKTFLETAYPHAKETKMFDKECPLSREYVIPKPLDPRVVPRVAYEVAKAAIESGIARKKINLETYEAEITKRINGHL